MARMLRQFAAVVGPLSEIDAWSLVGFESLADNA